MRGFDKTVDAIGKLAIVITIGSLFSCNTVPGRFAFPAEQPFDLRGRMSVSVDRKFDPVVGPNIEARALIASRYLLGISFSSALLWSYAEPFFGVMSDSAVAGGLGGVLFVSLPFRYGLASASGRWDTSAKLRLGAEVTYQLQDRTRAYLDYSISSEIWQLGYWSALDTTTTLGVSWQGVALSRARELSPDPTDLEQQRAGQDVFLWSAGNYNYFLDANVELRIPKYLEQASLTGGVGIYNE